MQSPLPLSQSQHIKSSIIHSSSHHQMKIFSDALLHAQGARANSAFMVSRQLSNCLVPWFITRTTETDWNLQPNTTEQLFCISPDTCQFIRSLGVTITKRTDLQRLISIISTSPSNHLFRNLESLKLWLERGAKESSNDDECDENFFNAEEVDEFIRKFSNLVACTITPNETWNLKQENWTELSHLFSNLFTPRPNLLHSEVLVCLVKSLTLVLDRDLPNISSVRVAMWNFCNALNMDNVVEKTQNLMLLHFNSSNQNVNDGRSLHHYFFLFKQLFDMRNKIEYHFYPPNPLSMSVEQMSPLFDLISTLQANGDLIRREIPLADRTYAHWPGSLLESVICILRVCVYDESVLFPYHHENSFDVSPEGLLFMRRYGRRLLPALLQTAIQDMQTKPMPQRICLFNRDNIALPNILRVYCEFIHDSYWYDCPLQNAADLQKMVDDDGRKVLSHFPLEDILKLILQADSHRAYSVAIVKCVAEMMNYITSNELLKDVGTKKDWWPDFFDPDKLAVEIANRLLLELDKDTAVRCDRDIDIDSDSKSIRVESLWEILMALVSPGRPRQRIPSSHPFVVCGKTSLFGCMKESYPGVEKIVLPLVSKTITFLESKMQDLWDQIFTKNYLPNGPSKDERETQLMSFIRCFGFTAGLFSTIDRFLAAMAEVTQQKRDVGWMEKCREERHEKQRVKCANEIMEKFTVFKNEVGGVKKMIRRHLEWRRPKRDDEETTGTKSDVPARRDREED